MVWDKIIIGAGLYGLYAALYSAKKGEQICVLERDNESFSRATYINQARVHMGYHYPRSFSTAIKSANYFERFVKDYGFCIKDNFEKIYATSKHFSWTNKEQFKTFSHAAHIRCDEIDPLKYFNEEMCDGAFVTREYTYDAHILRDYFLKELAKYPNVVIKYNSYITSITKMPDTYQINLKGAEALFTGYLLNAAYSGVNTILNYLGIDLFDIKYELCEIILCKVSDNLANVGITVMDGPFFSLMPFGNTGYHSLTSVTFTPHKTSYDKLATFPCQKLSEGACQPTSLDNCNNCQYKPASSWMYMSALAKKYLKKEYQFEYAKSLFSIKPILLSSEIDDSRPTVIRKFTESPTFVSVLSGKINTVYDLEEVL